MRVPSVFTFALGLLVLRPPALVEGQGECLLAPDSNSDGIVDVLDLLAVLGAFGCNCNGCGADANIGSGENEPAQCNSAGEIYVSSFNQFCGATLPTGSDAVHLRKQTKCWICEDIVKGYVANGMAYLPPAGTDFSPDSRVSHTLGFDFFVFGYDSDGVYSADPSWNSATIGGWPPAYTCSCMNGYDEDLSACQAACGGTYAAPAQTCLAACGDTSGCEGISCRRGYETHDDGSSGGGTTYYGEKVEHQYELSAMAGSYGAFFHGYFYDTFNSGGETVFTVPTSSGGFVSCAFNDYPWETSIDPASEMLAQAAASAANALYVSSFNQFCDGGLPTGTGETYIRQQTKCWVCEDLIKGYFNSIEAGSPYLPPVGTNFSPDSRTTYTLGGDFFVFGYTTDGLFYGMPEWNEYSSTATGWPPSLPSDLAGGSGGPCTCGLQGSAAMTVEDLSSCQAACGGSYPDPATFPSCEELCGDTVGVGCPGTDGVVTKGICRAHYQAQDAAVNSGTNYYNEKVEHQYELTSIATRGAYFHGYYLDTIDLAGETMFTHPIPASAGGGFMSCSFTDYPWENHDNDVTTQTQSLASISTMLETIQSALDSNGR